MIQITKYLANDGSQWPTEAQAHDRETLIEKVNQIMGPLGSVPRAVKDGEGWVHHDIATVNQCKQGILDLCIPTYGKSYPAFLASAENVHPLSIVGRILSDDDGPLGMAWNRFTRIDIEGREHQQCYFAYTNGPDPEHVCIEDRRK